MVPESHPGIAVICTSGIGMVEIIFTSSIYQLSPSSLLITKAIYTSVLEKAERSIVFSLYSLPKVVSPQDSSMLKLEISVGELVEIQIE